MIKIFESLEMNDFRTRGPTRLSAEIGDPAVSNSKIYAFCLGLPGRFAPKTARFARERVPKKIKTFFLRLFDFKTFLLASLDGRCDRDSQRCLRGARFARDENLEIIS